METKTFYLLSQSMLARQCCRWLCLFAFVLVGAGLSPASAQSKDVITFTGGAQDPKDPNIYVIDAGTQTNDNENIPEVTLTLSRPLSAISPMSVRPSMHG